MAEIQFTKQGGSWVAQFKAEKDFALHIERAEAGPMSMEQSTTGTQYAAVRDFPQSSHYALTFDAECPVEIAPKYIRVYSATEPTYAEVVSSGEVTELKFQEKAVEITANGTHTIAPDAGFAALNAVSVKVNVPTSGGGGSEDSWRYYLVDWEDIRTMEGYSKDSVAEAIRMLDMAYFILVSSRNRNLFTNAFLFNDYENWGLGQYKGIKWQLSGSSFDAEVGGLPIKEFLILISAEMPILKTIADRMTECTKEEFDALITA